VGRLSFGRHALVAPRSSRYRRVMRTILLVTCVLLSACKKKDEPKAADPAAEQKTEEGATGEMKPAEGAAAEVKITSASDYEARATEITNRLLATFSEAGKDCDKLAAGLSKLADDKRGEFAALKAFEQANPDAEKAFDAKMEARAKEFEETLAPAFDACQDHEGVKTAMEKLPLD
jgi:hypothetical protein